MNTLDGYYPMIIRPEVMKLLGEAEKSAPKTLKAFRPRNWQGRFRKRTESEIEHFRALEGRRSGK